MPVSEHEEKVAALRSRVAEWKRKTLDSLQDDLTVARGEIDELTAELEAAREKLAGSDAWCGTHGREKLCPVCCGADEYG
jgi:uncharacterized coiled-coil protein SlyX